MLSEELKSEIRNRFSNSPKRVNFTTLNNILTEMLQHETAFMSVTRQYIMDTTGEEHTDVLKHLVDINHVITKEDLELLPELNQNTPILCTKEYLEQANELIGLPLTDECLQELIDSQALVEQLIYWTSLRNYYVEQLPILSDKVISDWESIFQYDLWALEYKYRGVLGVWENNSEHSFFVVNINDDPDFYDNIFSLATKYNQDSFIYLKSVQRSGTCEGYFVNTNNNVRRDNTNIEQEIYLGYGKKIPFLKIFFGNNTIEIRDGTRVKNKFIICDNKWGKSLERWIDRTAVGKARKEERTPKETKYNASVPPVVSHPHRRHSYVDDTLMTPQERYERAEKRRKAFAKIAEERNNHYKQWLREDLEQKKLARRAAR